MVKPSTCPPALRRGRLVFCPPVPDWPGQHFHHYHGSCSQKAEASCLGGIRMEKKKEVFVGRLPHTLRSFFEKKLHQKTLSYFRTWLMALTKAKMEAAIISLCSPTPQYTVPWYSMPT